MHFRTHHFAAIFILIAGALSIGAIIGCDASTDPDWGVIWSGTVTDSAVGFAIDSAQIFYDADYPLDTFRLPHLYTDRDGNFRFDTDGTGPYYLIVRHSGYLTQIRQVQSATRKTIKGGINFKLVRQ